MSACQVLQKKSQNSLLQISFLKNVYIAFVSILLVYFYWLLIMDRTEKGTIVLHEVERRMTENRSYKPASDTPQKELLCDMSSYDFKGALQDDPKLINYVRRELLRPPSVLPYKLQNPEKTDFSQFGESELTNFKYLHGMKDGFFIEAGAVDGEFLSTTLFFERELGWRGLLVEPYPKTYSSLLTKNRKAYSINVGLSLSTAASVVKFNFRGTKGVMSRMDDKKSAGVVVKVIPLYSLLLALNVQTVDFLSLDIESFEVKVLKTLPWDKVKFRVMCIEYAHIPEGLPHLTKFLTSKGYNLLHKSEINAWYGWPSLLNSTVVN